MDKRYRQLGLNEREIIERLHGAGRSMREIGRLLCRSAGTISRELRRNSKPTKQWSGPYDGARADGLAQRRRRWDGRFKLARQPDLQAYVRDQLAMDRSPQQIAGRLAREQGRTIISHESIYRFIYHRSAQKDYWHKLLPQQKHRRGKLGKHGGSSVDYIKDRIPVRDRPAEAEQRTIAGHWEADLMLFSRYGQAVLVTHERCSRLIRIERLQSKASQGVIDRLIAQFKALPAQLSTSMTFDNGTEFALHYQLNAMDIKTYFCDPHSPWQKGGIENAIRRMRRRLPRRTDMATIKQTDIDRMVYKYNQTPRRCLQYQTPQEVFDAALSTVALQP
jgi:IS30 family transposase